MTVAEMEEKFAMPGVLGFEKTASGLVTVRVTSPAAEATVYLQGAHVTHWKPKGQADVIFVSAKAEYAAGKPIRGGVPVIFPWFAERHDGKPGPQHGFARTSEWTLAHAAMVGEDVHLTFTLGPNEASRSLGFDHFQLAYRVTVGRRLSLELGVVNDSGAGGARGGGAAAATAKADAASNGAPLMFEEALHTYYAVADATKVSIEGLGGTEYIDKVDGLKRKRQEEKVLRFAGRTDRPYLNTTATCVLRDEAGGRKIVIAKTGSRSTVVWNPWKEFTATMVDMEPDGWLHMTAIETANVGEDAVTLKAGGAHTMRAEISVEALR